MEKEHLIRADELCSHYNVEFSFINALQEYGLIEIITQEESYFIDYDQLQKLEQYTRWHYDLEINLEGIEVIEQMLERMKSMQNEIASLKNKLNLYEPPNNMFELKDERE
jgi:hypothetical protein